MMNYYSALLSSMTASALQAAQAAAAASVQNSSGIKRTEVSSLPRGWIREEIPSKLYNFHNGGINGNAKSTSDVVYYSPRGHRVSSKAEMSRLLGDAYDLTAFDFQTGKINPNLLVSSNSSHRRPSQGQQLPSSSSRGASSGRNKGTPTSRDQQLQQQKQQQQQNGGSSHKTGNSSLAIRTDNSLVPPIRQTASIFKQPVSVKKNSQVRYKASKYTHETTTSFVLAFVGRRRGEKAYGSKIYKRRKAQTTCLGETSFRFESVLSR